jgi:hypothetical protein
MQTLLAVYKFADNRKFAFFDHFLIEAIANFCCNLVLMKKIVIGHIHETSIVRNDLMYYKGMYV